MQELRASNKMPMARRGGADSTICTASRCNAASGILLGALSSRKAYPEEVAPQIETMGALAVSIANRWMLGWPDRVKALLKAGVYLECLESQTAQEKDILAKEADL